MQQVKRTHAVRCPVCGKGRVIDAAADVDPGRLHLYGPEHADKAELFSKCPKCGLQIGIGFRDAFRLYLRCKSRKGGSQTWSRPRASHAKSRNPCMPG